MVGFLMQTPRITEHSNMQAYPKAGGDPSVYELVIRKPYAWIIDHDLITDLAKSGVDGLEDGTTGPSDAMEGLVRELKQGEMGTRFLMQDREGQPIYMGRFIHLGEGSDDKGDDWFMPLHEFGRPKGDCTAIFYQSSSEDFHAWVML